MTEVIENDLKIKLMEVARESRHDPVAGTLKLRGYIENYDEETVIRIYNECIVEAAQENQVAA